jgi:peptide-methionine (R)-S-oxide reductase
MKSMGWTIPLTIAALFGMAITHRAAAMGAGGGKTAAKPALESPTPKVVKTEDQWKKQLTPDQFRILRKKGTEIAFTGAYWNNHAAGIYRCAGCGLELFRSDEKFESGTGWPSFWAPIAKDHVILHTDSSFGMVRTEVECARCGGHLGHVFDDGPQPTGQRYCMNSGALKFEKK